MNLTTIANEILAAQIVAYRTLGLNKELAIACMAELSRRKEQGDTFDFDGFIKTEVDKVPKLTDENLSINSGLNLIQELVKTKK